MRGRRVDPDRLRELIDALRIERRWSMGAFIAYSELSPTFVYYLLAGQRQPNLITAHHLAEKLGCRVEDFTVRVPVGGTPPPGDVTEPGE